MNTFPIQIATPDGLLYSGDIERVKVRAVTGDMAVLAGHCNFCTALGMGEAYIRDRPCQRREDRRGRRGY